MPDSSSPVQKELLSLTGKKYRFLSDRYYTPPGKFSVTFKGVDEQGLPVLLKKVFAGQINNEVSMPVRHPVLTPVQDIIRDEQEVYLVQAFKTGKNLRELATAHRKKLPLTESQLLRVVVGVIDGLDAMHGAGWMHGDIKPGNIIVDTTGADPAVHVVDFGKASTFGMVDRHDDSFSLVYSAPEIVLREYDLAGPSSDFYALGITLYELLERRPAFHHANPELLMHLMINQPLPAPRYIPAPLFSVILKMTHRSVFPRPAHLMERMERRTLLNAAIGQRYQSAAALTADLEKAWPAFSYPRPWWKKLVR